MKNIKIRSMMPALTGWRAAYTHAEDDCHVLCEPIAAWALITDDEEDRVIGLVAATESDSLVPASALPAEVDYVGSFLGLLNPSESDSHLQDLAVRYAREKQEQEDHENELELMAAVKKEFDWTIDRHQARSCLEFFSEPLQFSKEDLEQFLQLHKRRATRWTKRSIPGDQSK